MTASLWLLGSIFAVALAPAGQIKDGLLAPALCFAVAVGAQRGLSTAKAAVDERLGGNSPSPLGAGYIAAATTLSIVLVTALMWLGPDAAPRYYIVFAGAVAFLATFREFVRRYVPGNGSMLLLLVMTLTLTGVLLMWPDFLCVKSIIYICFVSQVVETVPLDSFTVAIVLNLASTVLEFLAAIGILPFFGRSNAVAISAGAAAGSIGAETVVWKSLKDLAVAGTLYPVLLAFDSDLDARLSGRRYFYAAVAVLLFCLIAVGAARIHVPLCFLSTPLLICAVCLPALVRSELSSLFSFRISASRVKKK